ncbi:hypothetical protein Thimo_2108 [Thioflavicoccus mobilis 8321]|uniref:Uncharacterized protein n=1 Tax=Thioflavicoccus mobilis 8321 TaxID=765912 RepID=L0GZV6_9GAMM|nr:hypothetical protein Thimo_2108 [Thioflavicoccus mobilis 8321]
MAAHSNRNAAAVRHRRATAPHEPDTRPRLNSGTAWALDCPVCPRVAWIVET